jgi:hypothetical protein
MSDIDPNEEYDEEFSISLREDSTTTYKGMKKIAKKFFEKRKDIKKKVLKNWKKNSIQIPEVLLTDSMMKSLFQFDYKQNKDSCLYYWRMRRLRGYLSFSLKFYNLPTKIFQ